MKGCIGAGSQMKPSSGPSRFSPMKKFNDVFLRLQNLGFLGCFPSLLCRSSLGFSWKHEPFALCKYGVCKYGLQVSELQQESLFFFL